MGRQLTPFAGRGRQPPDPLLVDAREDVHEAVFSWVAPRLRQLPWRDVRDPWKVLVSEVMLQQTSVQRVLGKWSEFVERFPTVFDCARSEQGEILRIWQGLGYPRRARNLHLCAQAIVSDFDGTVPDTVEALMSLPGIGPYTARAVVAFAFEGDTAVVDVNVARVLKRVAGQPLSPRAMQDLADALLPEGEAWLWNQAIMDLGAAVCRPRPVCDDCPLRIACRWRGEGEDPARISASMRQGRFEGSDRQARGRLMKALVEREVALEDVAAVMGRPMDDARVLAAGLVEEGLIGITEGWLHL